MQRFARAKILASLLLALSTLVCQAEEAADNLFHDHGLPSGSRLEVLPQNALLHVQLGNLYQTLTNVEQFAKAAVPAKALPEQMQGLAQMDHPLLTLLGMQLIQQPLTPEKVAESLGLDPQRPVSATLYLGDPRKMFILTVPMANPKAFEGAIKSILNPTDMEETKLSDKSAVKMTVAIGNLTLDLYVVCSASEAYICGDRSLAQALHDTPPNKRLNQDGFMRQVVEKVGGQDLSIIFNPSLLQPIALQLQQVGGFAIPMLQMQRKQLLGQMNPEVKKRVELQLRANLGVKDLDEFADYAECVIIASYQRLSDLLTKTLISFEGICLTANLNPAFPQLTTYVYSHEFQPERATQAIPMPEVRKAMAWLGKDVNSFAVTGRHPEVKPSPGFTAWLGEMKTLMTAKGLKTGFLEKFQELVQNEPINQPLTTKVPWMVTARAALNPPPPIADFQSLEKYFKALSAQGAMHARRPVHVMPGDSTAILETALNAETQTLNLGEKRAREFWEGVSGKPSWLDHANRFQASDLKPGIKQYVQESAFTTHGGIFGYDQHELINRRIFAARAVNGYVVYHQGARNVSWLAKLEPPQDAALSPAVERLLERLPEGVNSFHIQRVLSQLPGAIDWLSSLENLAHADILEYLANAEKVVKSATSQDEAQKGLEALTMPQLVYSLNRDTASSNLYCLLPGGVMFPRNKVTSILKTVTADFAAKADQLGGCITYSRVKAGVHECSVIQSTEALTLFISTVANTLMERYLGSPEKQQALMQAVMAEGDTNPERYEEILLKNPTWEFIPTPRPKRDVKAPKGLPKREANTSANLLNLSKVYNASLKDSWHAGGLADNTLANLPQGIQEFAGVQFDVRGIVQLSGKSAASQLEVRFPKEAKGIKVNQKGNQLHFLHATAWGAPEGTKIGSFVVHYANDETREIPIVYGEDVRDWWTGQNEPANDHLTVAWTGKNTVPDNETPIRLFKTTWKNPLPEVEMKTIDYRTTMSASAPFLIAITVE